MRTTSRTLSARHLGCLLAQALLPLRLPPPPPRRTVGGLAEGWSAGSSGGGSSGSLASGAPGAGSGGRSDVETAVVGHGLEEGPFTEIRRRRIRRDSRFPIRVTVQFYRATSNGIVDDADLERVSADIARVYDDADYVGSLVVGSLDRPTAPSE